jgi:drug/metabolite transporter (DMT)-like permease
VATTEGLEARRDATAAADHSSEGWLSGLIGVVIFSGTLPATRVAVESLSPFFVTSARATIAAILAIAGLIILHRARPALADVRSLAIVALGVVVGFPILTALALQHITAAHSIVFIGLLPLATAIFGVIRAGERPHGPFWAWAVIGAATVAGYALLTSGAGDLEGDLLMLGAVVLGGLGYAEGASLSRRLGGLQVISWALVIALPAMAIVAVASAPASTAGVAPEAWLGLAYVSVFSMYVGFVFWYRGLALGGIAAVGQLQLLQPFLGLFLAGVLLGEPVAPAMVAACAVVVVCVVGARRSSQASRLATLDSRA